MSKWTLQSLIDGKMTVTAYCHNSRCNHRAKIDLAAVRDRFGPDEPAMYDDLARRMRCAKCGGKAVGLIYAPDENKVAGMGKAISAYEKAKGR